MSRTRVKKDLLDQLDANGTYGLHYVDLVNKYMTMWDMAKALEKDFKENGHKILTNTGIKLNPSVQEYSKINNQMLRLLSELGLKPVPREMNDDYDEDM